MSRTWPRRWRSPSIGRSRRACMKSTMVTRAAIAMPTWRRRRRALGRPVRALRVGQGLMKTVAGLNSLRPVQAQILTPGKCGNCSIPTGRARPAAWPQPRLSAARYDWPTASATPSCGTGPRLALVRCETRRNNLLFHIDLAFLPHRRCPAPGPENSFEYRPERDRRKRRRHRPAPSPSADARRSDGRDLHPARRVPHR